MIKKIFWSWYALCYDVLTVFGPYQKMLAEIKKRLGFQKGVEYKILDAACGTGNLEVLLKEDKDLSLDITAVDFSPFMLNRARKKLRGANGVKFLACDLSQTLPFGDSTFDRIITVNALHALPLPDKTLAEFSRVLKHNGQMIIVTLKKGYQMPLIVKSFKHENESLEKWQVKSLFSWFRFVFRVFGFNATAFKFIFVAIFNKIIDKNIQGLDPVRLGEIFLDEGLKIEYSGLIYGDQDLLFVLKKPELLIKIARTEDELKQVFRLRQIIFVEESGLPIKDDFDEYDSSAVHFLAIRNNVPIGVMRLILLPTGPWSFRGLYKLPKLSFVFDSEKTLEISRFGFLKEGRRRNDFILLLGAAMSYAESCQFKYLCGTMRIELMKALRMIGINFDFVSEVFTYYDKWEIVAFIGSIRQNMKFIENKQENN